ncbi:LuxR C-terminal-related transcriptional regulator [Actinoplanes solisilvae]|uniref:LuxR C-terminal-related transcriptional regulator n=1 Tax=Actinoplanes solisilvae TaxID=2486853 RepID=UPI000FDCA5AD|nr:LuxR family transcriptional regulator [Actinoplanes solisilvae]
MNDLLPGRAGDLAAIHGFVDAATRDGGALLITGEPGMGKTVLLDAAARYGSAAGARILRTAGDEFGGNADYQALDQLLTPLHEGLAADAALRVALGLAGGPEPGLLRVSHETLDLLLRTGERRPLLVLVDAGQHLDGNSARVLTFAARRLAGSHVAMILAWTSLIRGGLRELALGPIDDEAAGRIIERRHPGIDPRVRDRLVTEAAGNPRALIEYADALTDDHRSGADPLPVPLPIGDRARAVTGVALAAFPPETREVLLLAALDEDGDLTAVRAAAGGGDVLAALSPVVRRGYVTVDERARLISFAHPMLRAAIVGHAAGLQLRRAHRALATAWAYEPERQGRHLAAAGGDADAMLTGPARESAAAARLRRATADAPQLATGPAHRLLVTAIEAYENNTDPDDPALIAALYALMVNCWLGAVPARWQAYERLRPESAGLQLVAIGLGNPVALTRRLLGEIDAAAAALGGEDNPDVITRTALACVYTDRLAACREPLARAIGMRAGLHATMSYGLDLWQSGRWTELLELTAGRALLAGYPAALVAVARGDSTAADAMAATPPGLGDHFAHQVRALAALGEGDHAAALREAASISPVGTLADYTPHALWVLLEVVEGALGAGRPADARAHVEAMTKAGLAAISPRLAMVTAGCAAMVDEDPAGFERALAVPEAERWPFDLARLQLAYGRLLRRRRQPVAARAQLTSALEIFQRLGARPWTRQATDELRAEGRQTAAPDDDRTLSPQERRVAELAAAGLSNKQIGARLGLSARTVGNHLYRVFPKLGITSRAALRDALP